MSAFWLLCVPVRFIFATIKHPIIPLLAGGMSVSFLGRWLIENNKVKKSTGAFGDDPYWHNLRLVHALNYALYAAFYNMENSSMILYGDLLIGICGNLFLK